MATQSEMPSEIRWMDFATTSAASRHAVLNFRDGFSNFANNNRIAGRTRPACIGKPH
jgi:hypothetical protein